MDVVKLYNQIPNEDDSRRALTNQGMNLLLNVLWLSRGFPGS